MNKRATDLVRKLLLLYGEYGPKEFEAAFEELRDGKAASLIVAASSELSRQIEGFAAKGSSHRRVDKLRPRVIRKQPDSTARRFERFLEEISQTDRRREVAVANFLRAVASKEALTNTRAIKEYLEYLGLPYSASKIDRFASAIIIGQFLLNVDDEKALQLIESARQFENAQSTLQGWSKMIVKTENS